MPVRNAKRRRNDQVLIRTTKGKTRSGQVMRDQSGPSVAPTGTTATTGGTLAAGTYSYRVSLVYGTLETAPSPARAIVTTGTTSTTTVDFSALVPTSGQLPTQVKVYGRTGGSELLMGTVTLPTTTFTDTGAATPAGALPTDTGQVSVHMGPGYPNLVVGKMTTWKGATQVYMKR